MSSVKNLRPKFLIFSTSLKFSLPFPESMRNKLPLLLAAVFLLSAHLPAQNPEKSRSHTINSSAFEGEREVLVHLPGQYLEDSAKKFMVAFVLDAQADEFWEMAKSNIDYLMWSYQVIPMIVVGVVSESRGSEFSPKNSELTEHFRSEIIPLIDANYRTSGYNIIIGHSWGGAFVGNTLFSENRELFDGYIGISPSLGAIDGRIFKQADSMLAKGTKMGKYFFCSSGDLGINEFESVLDIATMDSVIGQYGNPTLAWQTEMIPNTTHWTCVAPSLIHGLTGLCRNYRPDAALISEMMEAGNGDLRGQIRTFYKDREENFGYSYPASDRYWAFHANSFWQIGEPEIAAELYLLAIEEGNENVTAFFDLGNLYLEMEDKTNARKYLKTTSDMLEAQKGDMKESLYNSLRKEVDRLLEELK